MKQPKIETAKYNLTESEEIIACTHCRTKTIYQVSFYFENRPKRIDGNLVIPLEMLETKVYTKSPSPLCDRCEVLPRCGECGIILCGRRRHTHSWPAVENPNLCQGCYDWKSKDLSTDGT